MKMLLDEDNLSTLKDRLHKGLVGVKHRFFVSA